MLLRVRSCVKVSRAEQLRRVGTESEARMQEIVKKLPGTVQYATFSLQGSLFWNKQRLYRVRDGTRVRNASQLLALRLTCRDLSAKRT